VKEMRRQGALLIKIILTVSVIVMLLTLDIAVAADKESMWDVDRGFWGEYAKVRVGGETPDKKYYRSCWISFETRGTTFISVKKTEAWLYGYKEPNDKKYELGHWSYDYAVDKVRSRDPQSGTYSVKGICKGYFKSWTGDKWSRTAEREIHASDPPIVPAIVFFNVTS